MSLEITGTVMGPLQQRCPKTVTTMSIAKRDHHRLKKDSSTSRMTESRAIVHAIWTLAATLQVSRKSFLHQQVYLSFMQYHSFGRSSFPLGVGHQLADVVAPRGADCKYAYQDAITPSPSIITSPSQQSQISVLSRTAPTSIEAYNLAVTCYPPTGIWPSGNSISTLNAISSASHPPNVSNDGAGYLAALSVTKKKSNDKAKAELFEALRATPSPPKHQPKKSTLLKARTIRNLQTIPEHQEWKMTYSNLSGPSPYFILEEFQPKSIFENDSDSDDDDDDEDF